MVNDTRAENSFAELLERAEEEIAAGGSVSQFLIALRRVAEQGCAIDPQAPVASFSSAF